MSTFSFFNSLKEKEYIDQIEKLEEKVKLKEKEVSDLIAEIESFNKINPRQLEVFEKNIKESKDENFRYKSVFDSFGLNLKRDYFRYRLDIDKFYPKKRFPEILSALQENGVNYLEDLKIEAFETFLKNLDSYDEAKKRFSDYLSGKMEWEIKTFLNKGEKTAKIYSKPRKLATIFSENYLEYMDDLETVDFSFLRNYEFTDAKILEFKSIRDDYYIKNRNKI